MGAVRTDGDEAGAAMMFKSREREVHGHVCQEIENRLARTDAPREVRHFLLGRWSYLLVGIYSSRGDQHPDWEAGWHTVNALLWSLTPKRDAEAAGQLVRLLPTLLGRLHDGCDAMRLQGPERDELFAQLALLHAAAMRDALHAGGAGGPLAGLGADAERAFTDAELAALAPAEMTSPPETGPAEAVDGLRVGDRIRLCVEGRDKTLSLEWISPARGMFLFAGKDGYDAMSLSRSRLLDKLAKGEVRLGE